MSKYGIILSTLRKGRENMPAKRPEKPVPTPEECAWFEANLTHELWRRLYNEAYCYVHNKADAEDLTEEAVRIGLANISLLREEKKFAFWMLKIVRREALHHLARESSKMNAVRYAFMYMKDLYDSCSTPDKLLISREESERLRAEIKRLRSPEKEIMMLKLTTRKSLKEIAAELNLNYHTTRSKFTRACKLLKRRLEKEEGDDADERK